MSIKVIDYAAVKEVEKLNDKVCDCLNYQGITWNGWRKLIPLNFKHTFLIDVREHSEFQFGHIPTALNIPLVSFQLG
jgi:3-mercaptopyruvate sulfurtransferase SseA